MTDNNKPVVISGGGPTGLALALGLARAGVPVVVLEAERELPTDQRAATFHPPTLEILERLGVAGAMHEEGIVVRRWQFCDRKAGPVAEFDLGLLADETPYPYRLHLEQHRLSGMLLERLRGEPAADVRLGCRVRDFDVMESKVTVTYSQDGETGQIEASWLIGADGARSVVRHAAGIAFEGFTWPTNFLVTSAGLDLSRYGFAKAAYIADPDHWAAVFKIPHFGARLWRIAYAVDPEADEQALLEPAAVHKRLETIFDNLGLSGADFALEYTSIYRVHQRVAETFRKGRIMLAGDAAHINNPLGGFGLNAGIQDAASLTDKLVHLWKGEADESILDLYDRQHRPLNVETVQAMSIRNKRIIEMRDSEERHRQLQEMREIADDAARAKEFLMNTSMINFARKAAAPA